MSSSLPASPTASFPLLRRAITADLGTSLRTELDIHRGAIDETTITNQPSDAMIRLRAALRDMGIVVQAERKYRYRCVRPRRLFESDPFAGENANIEVEGSKSEDHEKASLPKGTTIDRSPNTPPTSNPDLDAYSPSSPVIDSTLLVIPAVPLLHSLPILNTLSHNNSSSTNSSSATSSSSDVELVNVEAKARPAIAYGTHSEDPGDEVRFTVEVTRLARLEGTYSADIRRLKGDLRSYKYVYNQLRKLANLNIVGRHSPSDD